MITLECNYSKKLGLPGYSSHQFAITLRTEISDLTQVQPESARLYKLLQEGVDTSIKETGYLVRSKPSCGSPMIEFQQAPQPLSRLDLASR